MTWEQRLIWGQRLRRLFINLGVATTVVVFIAGIFVLTIYSGWFPDWTGFGADQVPANTPATPVVVYQQAKTLWDWLQLLLIPSVLAIGGAWLTRSENRIAQKLQDQRDKLSREIEADRIAEARRIEDERIAEARQFEINRAQDAILQTYLDAMTQLLLDKNLGNSKPEDDVRSVARARTLTVLSVLDSKRKTSVLRFLYEARLCGHLEPTDEIGRVIVDLFGADLSGADLSEASLSGANLDGADLSEAGLGGAFLIKASLIRADLSGADLSGADLSGATLSGTLGGATPHWLYSSAGTPTDAIINARITPEQLASAKSYAGAILPDGTKAPG